MKTGSKDAELKQELIRRGVRKIGWFLADALEEHNECVIGHIRYALQQFGHLPNLSSLLREIAEEDGDSREGERRFRNRLTVLFAARGIEETLKLRVMAIESKEQLLHSPHLGSAIRCASAAAPSCDIKVSDGSRDLFFEVKDNSSELTSGYLIYPEAKLRRKFNLSPEDILPWVVARGPRFFNPATIKSVRKWLLAQLKEAHRKGADYLMCRTPLGIDHYSEQFDADWVNKLFPIRRQISPTEFEVELAHRVPPHLKAIHIIKRVGNITLRPVSSQNFAIAA